MIVVDASAIVHLLLMPAADPEVIGTLESAGKLNAPHLIDAEVLNALRKRVFLKEVSSGRARQAIEDFGALTIKRWPITPFTERIWALRHNLTAYDASYVALAEALGVPVVTRDGGIKGSSGHKAKIILV
jgi:predicted nucleic acid-binding protein